MATNRSISVTRGGCPAPLFSAVQFPETGGFVDGRLCQDFGSLHCCLPCPIVDYVYPDSFEVLTQVANWVSVAGAVAAVFLLASWAFLPVDRTSRHYLSISLTLSVAFMNLGFIIPLASQPEECYDAITPNDMASSKVCAASGTLLLLGGWAGVTWTFIRALSLHLQICWQFTVGRPFMIISHIGGWGIPVAGVLIAVLVSGVSFRFGPTCHINHRNSLADFWIPLLVFSGLTVILTISTFAYCVKVYLASLSDNGVSTGRSEGLPSHLHPHLHPQGQYAGSLRTMATMTPRQAYRRVRRVVQLQWRGITIVLIIIADIIFFSLVFVFQDSTMQDAQDDLTTAHAWVQCLIESTGDKYQCLDKTDGLAVRQGTVAAVLFLLALNGIWLLFLLGKKDMVFAWKDLIKDSLRKRKEFVSADARFEAAKQQRTYEMLPPPSPAKLNDAPTISSGPPSPKRFSQSPDCFEKPPETALAPPPPRTSIKYHAPARSFSSPRPPQSRDGHPPGNYTRPTSSAAGSVSPVSVRSGAGRYPPPINSIKWEDIPPPSRHGPDGPDATYALGANRV